jgi:hypothetical protein
MPSSIGTLKELNILSDDVINYCIVPFLVPSQKQWKQKFSTVISQFTALQEYSFYKYRLVMGLPGTSSLDQTLYAERRSIQKEFITKFGEHPEKLSELDFFHFYTEKAMKTMRNNLILVLTDHPELRWKIGKKIHLWPWEPLSKINENKK